jgi:DNA-binding response OmpR family regulator
MTRYTILIVDDTLSCRESVAVMLRRSGYRVICAENSRRALDLLEDTSPDLMLLDLAMPDSSGPEFLQSVRADLRWRDLPVILFTGSGDVMELARDMGVRDCLVKSHHSFSDVRRAIECVLHGRSGAAA